MNFPKKHPFSRNFLDFYFKIAKNRKIYYHKFPEIQKSQYMLSPLKFVSVYEERLDFQENKKISQN